jgi:hypothetical protein
MNDEHFVSPSAFKIPSDDELRHWLAYQWKVLNDPKHQGSQAQMIIKNQIVIVEELLHRRSSTRSDK